MRLKANFITQEIDGTQFIVPVGRDAFSGIIRSNETAAFIVNALSEDTTKEAIVEKMLSVYDAPREVVEADVGSIIEKLRSVGAIEE